MISNQNDNTVGRDALNDVSSQDTEDFGASSQSGLQRVPADRKVEWRLYNPKTFAPIGFLLHIFIDEPTSEFGRLQLNIYRKGNRRSVGLTIRSVLLDFPLIICVLCGFGVGVPFSTVWGIGSLLNHSPIFVAFVGCLSMVFTVWLLYLQIFRWANREPETEDMMGKITAFISFFLLPMSMYLIAAPYTTRFETIGEEGELTLISWLVYFGYMAANILGLGSPQAIFGEIAALRPTSVAAAVGTLWVNALMVVGVFTWFWKILKYLTLGDRLFSGTVEELRAHIASNGNLKKSYIIPRHIFMNSTRKIPFTRADALDLDKPWSLLWSGSIVNEESCLARLKEVERSGESTNLGSRFDDDEDLVKDFVMGFSFIKSGAVLVLSFAVLWGGLQLFAVIPFGWTVLPPTFFAFNIMFIYSVFRAKSKK
ncbi:hypothetical protein [Cyclobacterium salsum]|uniref:hypothetical protein n=1 Tax=Cyclobacterium salsum TaxID=2666329 RepID=UPI001391C919|nr:hypothetical protein [Cyclobacterium salsum]